MIPGSENPPALAGTRHTAKAGIHITGVRVITCWIRCCWIPAFAKMTDQVTGMTFRLVGRMAVQSGANRSGYGP